MIDGKELLQLPLHVAANSTTTRARPSWLVLGLQRHTQILDVSFLCSFLPHKLVAKMMQQQQEQHDHERVFG